MAVPDHPLLQGHTSISLRELSEQPLILSHRYRKYMLAAFEGAGLVCDIYFACEDARTAMTMAEKGLGIAILPESMLKLTNKLKHMILLELILQLKFFLHGGKAGCRRNYRIF